VVLAQPVLASMHHSRNRTATWALQMLHRGIYADQLAPYLARFPVNEQLLILRSEDFFANEAGTMARLAAFLDLDTMDWTTVTHHKFNFARGQEIQQSDAEQQR